MQAATSQEAIRAAIDRLDADIVMSIAARAHHVQQAAAFKRDTNKVRVPARVEQIMARV
ncbi:chorismate mutase [Chitinivorax sp. B]|uniref:chorismate mutase n=1 Tax=Chitinivorax sp. B TaxID=2502235 RepID=UPI0032D5A031